MKRIKENTLREMRRTFNECFNSLNLLEGKRKVREMARIIKDYDTFKELKLKEIALIEEELKNIG